MARKRGQSPAERRAMFYHMKHDHVSSPSRSKNSSHFGATKHDERTQRSRIGDTGFSNRYKKKRSISKRKVIPKKVSPKPTSKSIFDVYDELKKIRNIAENIPPEKFVGLIAVAASTATGNPIPLMLYQGYKSYEYAKKLSEKFEEGKIKDELKELTRMNLQSVGQKALDKKTEEISKKVTNSSTEIGLIPFLAKQTSFSEHSVSNLFQSTTHDAIESGIGNMANLAVETIF